MHRIPWNKNESYGQICERYCDFVSKKYKDATIAFDGYGQVSTKDIAHLKRNKVAGREVYFTLEMKMTTRKEDFLSNTSNKVRFLRFLSTQLKSKGFTVKQASGDADYLIVSSALECATKKETVLIGEDTDLLVLLIHLCSTNHKTVFFSSEPKKGAALKTWNIQEVQKNLGKLTCQLILFAHAFNGCDTTSRLYGIGKSVALKLIHTNETFQKCADLFMHLESTATEIEEAGEKAMVLLYGGQELDLLNTFHYDLFQRQIAKATTFVHPQDLPPTSAATKFHSFRVFHQV